MKPPMLARLLLFAVAGEGENEFVAGDLHEEFIYLCATRGRPAGSRWYAWQVVRSVVMLLALRMRSGEALQIVLAGLGVSGGLPATLGEQIGVDHSSDDRPPRAASL